MKRLSLGLPVLLAGAIFLAGEAALAPAWADTTVAQYDKMSKAQQADLVGSLVQSLAELHGGRLEIESQPEHGTTVTVAFPPARVLRARVVQLRV